MEQAPLYWSGELERAERERFAAHVEACPQCEQELDAQAQVDTRLAAAVGGELPDAGSVQSRVRREIGRSVWRRRWIATGAIAAGLLVAFAGVTALRRPVPAPRWYADAARDHRVEVVQGEPRRWRRDAGEIAALATQTRLTYEQVAGLAASGYSLERAKFCGLGGQRMLHLVFSDGSRRYSVYVGLHLGQDQVGEERTGSEQVAGFATDRVRGVVVMAGTSADCAALARAVAARL